MWFSLPALVGLLSLALVMSLFGRVEKAAAAPVDPPAPAPASDWVEPTGAGLVRPDVVSAAVTARSSGQRVEVLSKRTETNRTWALPTGGFDSESSSAPVRFKKVGAGNDGWVDIDTTLVTNADGTVTPKAVPDPVVLGGQGDPASSLVIDKEGQGKAVTLGAGVDHLLPAPVIAGSTATYPEVMPGVDVTVEVRPTGFEQLWVAKTRAGLDQLLTTQAGGGQGVDAAMSADALTATPQANGSVVFTDAQHQVVSKLNAPAVWDAASAPGGQPTAISGADFNVVDNGAPLPVKTGATGDLQLSVVPDQAWLADPARQFPVTIDPTYVSASTSPIFDTWVQEDETTDKSTSPTLPVGMDSTGIKSRSFFNFDTSPFTGKTIASASLVLWGQEAGTCTANGWSSYSSGPASTATRWTAQPTLGAKFATSTQTKGFGTGCPPGSVSIDMKAQVQAWAGVPATTKGVVLMSDNETSYTYYHRFNSSEAAMYQPVLRWSYDRAPATPAVPSVADTVTFKPSGASTSYLYTKDRRPNLSAVMSDPDLDTVKATFGASATNYGSTVSSCTSALVASGTTAGCELGTDLAADGAFFLRGQATDQLNKTSGYGAVRELRVAAVTPAAPVVSCPAPYDTSGSWQTTAPAMKVTCTISAAGTGFSSPSQIGYAIDGLATYTHVTIPQSSSASVAKIDVSIPLTDGGHSIRAWSYSPTGLGAPTNYFLGWGSTPLLKRPNAATPRITTIDKVEMNAAGPAEPGTNPATATTQWRVSGASGTAGWIDAPVANTMTVTQLGGQSQAAGMFDTTTIVGQADASQITVNGRVPTLIDVRVCITLSTGTTCSNSATVLRVPHAFGDAFPTANAGPGQVALWTGELQVDDSDAKLATPDGSLSVSRTHSSFASTPAPQNRVFGPGWTAAFDGNGTGAGGAELYDSTNQDGTLAVLDSDGTAKVFSTPTGARRTTTTIATGSYKPADADTRTSGMTLTVSGSGAATVAELTGDDGVITKFQATAAPTTDAATFQTVEVREPAVPGKTTYSYDSAGRVTAITAALPDGVTSCTPGTATAGCRVLKIVYATTTTATSTTVGDYAGQVKQIVAQVNTDADRELAAYKYDSSGRMVEAKDSRTGLTTGYGWTGSGTTLRLATLTPPGQDAYTFVYDTTVNKLAKVTRPNPASAGGGTAQLAAFVYGVPVSGTGLPDLSSSSVGRWAQAAAPTAGFAVFGQDKPVSGTSPAGIASGDWAYADLQYTDPQGYTVNTASYGAGDWQETAADYDAHDNVIHSWDERALRGIIDGTLPGGGEATNVATVNFYNDDITDSSLGLVTPAGTLVTDVYGPVHEVVSHGVLKQLRSRTHTSYDEGAPNGGINPDNNQPYRLPTTTVTTADTTDGTTDDTLTRTFTSYDALVSGDTTGWQLGQATSTTTDMDLDGTISAGDITTRTRYDDRGRVIENRQPKSDGTDAGTRVTAYYTAGTSTVSGCGSKPSYAGLSCQVGPAAQPAGQTMPTTKTTGYTWDDQATTEADVSGAVTSTTTTSYDTADRPKTVSTSVSGLTGSQPVPATTTSYDPATGETTATSSTAGTTATGFDSLGRQTTYTNTPAGQTADTSTTTYDAAGRVASVVDNNGQTTYSYDGTDAAGHTEHRGLTTSIAVKSTGGTDYTSTGAYDPAGDLVLEKLPGQVIRRHNLDLTGELTQLTYNGQADDGTGTLVSDQPWFGWGERANANSQTTWETTTDGAGPSGALGATTTNSDRTFTYDPAGRLTTVNDNTGANPCQTRTYSFDANGNRTNQDSHPAATDGSCSAATTGAPTTRAYDTDAARTITQNGTTTTFTLDGAGRRLGQTTATGGTTTNTLVRHYTDDSDNPTWSVDTTNSTTTRYNELLDSDLGLALTTTGANTTAQLDLATPHGDSAATINLPSGATNPTAAAAAGIDTWTDYAEYGTPRQTTNTTPGGITGIGYGWLGVEQRATTDSGLALMGARLYNPATGLFSSLDPDWGGNSTAYSYPQDPLNATDLDGHSWWDRFSRAATRFEHYTRWLRPWAVPVWVYHHWTQIRTSHGRFHSHHVIIGWHYQRPNGQKRFIKFDRPDKRRHYYHWVKGRTNTRNKQIAQHHYRWWGRMVD